MLEVFPDRLYSLTAGVHMRVQSSGFGSLTGIGIPLRWLELVLGFLCPLSCQVKISERIYVCNVIFREKLDLGGSVIINEEILPDLSESSVNIYTQNILERPHQTNSAGKSKWKGVCYTEEEKQFISIKTRQKPVFKIQMCI